MYKGHTLFDEQQDKYDNEIIHDGENSTDYSNQENYNSGSDVYNSEKGEEEKKKEEATGIEKDVIDQEKKYDKGKGNVSDEDIKKSAASEVHDSTKNEDDDKKKNTHKSIEDAINKAMKDEKEIIYMDD